MLISVICILRVETHCILEWLEKITSAFYLLETNNEEEEKNLNHNITNRNSYESMEKDCFLENNHLIPGLSKVFYETPLFLFIGKLQTISRIL